MEKKIELRNARGFSDIPPERKILRNDIMDKIRVIFEKFGYSPLETPMVERFDVLSAKYAGGSEILKETFKLTDQGGRELGLRYDLTIPFCRYIGMNKDIKMPFKRYQMSRVFRDGPIKLGRTREFWQCDVDVVGSKSMMADAQMVEIAQRVFAMLGLEVDICINNRKILNGIIDSIGITDKIGVIMTIDKLKKVGEQDVKAELMQKGLTNEQATELLTRFQIKGTNEEKIRELEKIDNPELQEGVREIKELLGYLESQKDVVFAVSLARGLAYYTGPVFEAFMKTGNFKSSLCGGGRYDDMIGAYLQSKEPYPATGISFGIEPITVVLGEQRKTRKSVTQLFIIPIGDTQNACIKLANDLRTAGLNVDVDLNKRKVSKNLQYASSYEIPFALIVGEDEIKDELYTLRNMITGEEKKCSLNDIYGTIITTLA